MRPATYYDSPFFNQIHKRPLMKTIYRLPAPVLVCWLCLLTLALLLASAAPAFASSAPGAVSGLTATHNGASVSAS